MKKKIFIIILFLLVVLIGVTVSLKLFTKKNEYYHNGEMMVFYNGKIAEKNDAIMFEDNLFLSMEYIKKNELFDIYWDKDYNRISIFSNFEFHKITYNVSKANYRGESFERDDIFIINGNELFISAEFLSNGFIDDCYVSKECKIIIIGRVYSERKVYKDVKLKSLHGNNLIELRRGTIVKEYDFGALEHVLIRDLENRFFIAEKKDLIPYKTTVIRNVDKDRRKENIVLAWDLITAKINKFKPFEIDDVITIIAPTWYDLDEVDGYFRDISSREYTDYVQGENVKIWPTFTNDFNPDLTNKMLNDATKRSEIIDRIIEITEKEKYDGVNIDFENVYMKDRDAYSVFVMELYCKARKKAIPISVDVAVLSNSETWSKFLDRKAIGKYSDYVLLMAYDENVSGVAGSVASLEWVEYGVVNLLESVSANKVAMAVPFYTRLWEENIVDGKTSVKATALRLESAEKFIEEYDVALKYDNKTGQNYGEKIIDGVMHKIWNEDETSMKARMDIVKKYNLVGKGIWAFSFGTEEMWDVLK